MISIMSSQIMRLLSFITFNVSSIHRKGRILLEKKGAKGAKESWIKWRISKLNAQNDSSRTIYTKYR